METVGFPTRRLISYMLTVTARTQPSDCEDSKPCGLFANEVGHLVFEWIGYSLERTVGGKLPLCVDW